MVMVKVNIAEAKAKLSEFLEQVTGGDDVVICRHNKPVARLVAIASAAGHRSEPRPIGGVQGEWAVPDSFFEPLPADLEAQFYPGLEGGPAAKVAETSGS